MKKAALLGIILSIILVLKIHWESELKQSDLGYRFQIHRDQHGIPHIAAYNKIDLAFGMGYAQAQDRMWTLFFKKKLISGTLSEMLGSETLKSDKYMRNIGFANMGKINANLMDEETKKYVESYVKGINTYVKNLKMLPLQFYLVWTDWQQFTIEDSHSVLLFASFMLQFDWMYELGRQRLLETVGFSLAQKIFPFGQHNLFREVTIVNDEQLKDLNLYKKHTQQEQQEILTKHWKDKNMSIGSIHLPRETMMGGSNSWVVGGEHTFHGKPILASDPHLGLLIPSLFYMIEIILLDEKNEVINQCFGAMLNGIPSISIGVTKYQAWGATAAYIDNKDVYYQTVRQGPNYKYQYLFEDQWHDFTIREEIIKVRGGPTLIQQYFHTHRGPVLQSIFLDVHPKYGFPFPKHFYNHHTISLNAAIYRPDSTSMKGLIDLAFTNSLKDFQEEGFNVKSPNVDCTYIFKDQAYGYASLGGIPKRQIPEMGSFIKDGSKSIYDMGDFIEPKLKPKLMNPKKGYVSMCNNKFTEDSYQQRSSLHQISTGRSYRIKNLIQAKIKKGDKFTFEDMIDMQLDQTDDFLSEAFPHVLKVLKQVKDLWITKQTQEFYQLLIKWDYNMAPSSIQTSLYHVWEDSFQHLFFQNQNLTQEEVIFIIHHAYFQIYQLKLFEKMGNKKLGQQERIICQNNQNINITNIHPCIVNAALAFKKLPSELKFLFGSDKIQDYQWGKIHQNVFQALPWSQIPIISKLYTRSYEEGGNSRTLNVAIPTHKTRQYTSIAGPIVRFITDLNRTIFSYDTGESENIFSPFYGNFIGKNVYIEYIRRNPVVQKNIKGWQKTYDSL